MAEFKVDEFVNALDIDVPEGLNKDQLIALGKHLGCSEKELRAKNEIFTIIYQKYVDDGIFQELDDAVSTESVSVTNFEVELKNW